MQRGRAPPPFPPSLSLTGAPVQKESREGGEAGPVASGQSWEEMAFLLLRRCAWRRAFCLPKGLRWESEAGKEGKGKGRPPVAASCVGRSEGFSVKAEGRPGKTKRGGSGGSGWAY